MHFGTPKDFEKDCFTRVLKGQISLTQAVFPNKIKGIYLDSLARQFLWEAGLDFSHGTGHGVGHYLNPVWHGTGHFYLYVFVRSDFVS
jgi:Xaa-Pro aminopeptidase